MFFRKCADGPVGNANLIRPLVLTAFDESLVVARARRGPLRPSNGDFVHRTSMMRRQDGPRRLPMNRKIVGILGFVAVLQLAGLSTAGSLPSEPADWRADYLRPIEIPFPEDNPFSQAKAELGHSMFFDPVLSGSRTRSCATCHNPGLSWGDGLTRAIGEGDARISRRTPTTLNLAWVTRFGWDGKFRDLEAFTFGPITSAANMNSSKEAVIKR